MTTAYRNMKADDKVKVTAMILSLYSEDPGTASMSPEKAMNTIEFFGKNPGAGCIKVFEHDSSIAGYAILVNFHSNEFGGNIVIIDEMFVEPEFRGKNIGSDFIRSLAEERRGDSVALQVEVSPGNKGARRLYERLGFREHRNTMFDLALA